MRSALLGFPEDAVDFRDLAKKIIGHGDVRRVLGVTGRLGRLPEKIVQLWVLFEMGRLEIISPQDPQVMLDEFGSFFLDEQAAGLEGLVIRRRCTSR